MHLYEYEDTFAIHSAREKAGFHVGDTQNHAQRQGEDQKTHGLDLRRGAEDKSMLNKLHLQANLETVLKTDH